MIESIRPKRNSRYVALMVVFLITLNVTLGYLLTSRAASSIVVLMHTRMLDVSNTAAAMIDGDVLRTVTPADAGTEGYESIMRTLSYFQDNIDLRYIYCIRDMGDGTFAFGLDPTVDDPGEFGSPIVYTDALYRASQGVPSADDVHYEDAWGAFYSAYSPVLDSAGQVAGIIAVDFDAAWYDHQLSTLGWTTFVVALVSLLVGGFIVEGIIHRSQRRINSIHGQLNDLQSTLLEEMGQTGATEAGDGRAEGDGHGRGDSIDDLERQIQSMQTELKTQAAQMHGVAYRDSLTGVKSKHAYLETLRDLDVALAQGELDELAFVVCDVNGLKQVNDTLGHQAGDAYIRDACHMVCDVFGHSPVFRVGGDEFVAVLTGRDFEDRRLLMHELHRLSLSHIATGDVVVSGGMSELVVGRDSYVQEVFERADAAMYEEKALLKSLGAASRDERLDTPAPEALDVVSLRNTRRALLIADDMEANREILGDLLEEDYDIFFAADGVEAMSQLELHKDEIALLLLDLYMPNMTGFEVMARMHADEDLMSIPVIVLTVDVKAELDSLRIGAMDFISKPYPDIDIIKARISKCIELSESRELIRSTQFDRLTGLLNFDYFVRYVSLVDLKMGDAPFDAIVVEIAGLHEVAERHGREIANLAVRGVGRSVRQLARRTGGVGCREGDGTFYVYCPHQEDPSHLIGRFLDDLLVDEETASRVRLKIGIFAHAEAEPIVEERLAYARLAAEDAEDDPSRLFGTYDGSR